MTLDLDCGFRAHSGSIQAFGDLLFPSVGLYWPQHLVFR